ncbi:MAG: hypothetical protein RIC55_02800 [Pirellulaceae bacterium]
MDENAKSPYRRRWWQISVRSVLVFVAIYAAYIAAMLGFWELLGSRAIIFPALPIAFDCLLLLFLCATAAISARSAFLLQVDFDWRRGCLRLCLAVIAAALFVLPFLWAFLMAGFAAALRSGGV